MKEIKLTQGRFAMLDNEDFDRVNQFRWYADKDKSAQVLWYAARHVYINGRRTTQKLHQFILGDGEKIDHRNGNGLDNRKENLRRASASQNGANRRKQVKPASSTFKGVTFVKARGNWRASIKINGSRIPLGSHSQEIDAATAYNEAARRLFGEFAKLNRL